MSERRLFSDGHRPARAYRIPAAATRQRRGGTRLELPIGSVVARLRMLGAVHRNP